MAPQNVQQAPAEVRQFVAPAVQYTDQASFEDAIWQTAQDTLDVFGHQSCAHPAALRLGQCARLPGRRTGTGS